jgi:hypothetical protein
MREGMSTIRDIDGESIPSPESILHSSVVKKNSVNEGIALAPKWKKLIKCKKK